MSDSKISNLTNYTPPIDTDVLPIVDVTTSTTKKITWANIKATLKTTNDTLYKLVAGVEAVNRGGTGVATLTDKGILFGNGTSVVGITAVGTATHVLTSNGAGVAPTFQSGSPGMWTYLEKLTFASETTTKTSTTFSVRTEWMLLFDIQTDAVSTAVWLSLTLNGVTSGYLGMRVFNNAITAQSITGSHPIGGSGTSSRKNIAGSVHITGKHSGGVKSILNNTSAGLTSNDHTAPWGKLEGNSADLTSLSIISAQAVTGTIELWYRDAK